MAKIFLKKKISDRIAQGHLWVFANEIGDIVGDVQAGDIVDLFSSSGSFVGRGYYNAASQIPLRLLSKKQVDINEAYFVQQLSNALTLRLQLGFDKCFRLINSESDALPGLIIDIFEDVFVMQTHTMGMEVLKPLIVAAMVKLFNPTAIYERNDIAQRRKEGLAEQKGLLYGKSELRKTIHFANLQLNIDIAKGPKTGFGLEQQQNISLLNGIAKDAKVLDVFCYSGAFSIYAAKAGAKQVIGVDYAPEAIVLAQENAKLNGLENVCTFECRNAFDLLKVWAKEKKQFDVVILDPPPLIKGKEDLARALSAYKEINLRAMQLLKPGGFLLTNCSTHLISENDFFKSIADAAVDAKRNIKQLAYRNQSADHTIIWQMPNTKYLKCLLLQVND